VFVSHDAAAVERLCTRAVLLREGRLVFDGPVREAITRYHSMLADERDPEERGAGLSEYGSGEVRIAGATLLGPDGETRNQFAPGETLSVVLRIVSARPVPAPRLSYELHDEAGLQLAGGVQETAELGWDETRTEHALRLEIDGLPLADGRFRFRFELADASGAHLYHWLDDAARFVVYPADGETGLVRLHTRWSLAGEQAPATIGES
jgi:lipopolysaccharide transport system ATP-binding protein